MTSLELRLVNAFIGFCTPTGGTWPAPLAELGYVACGVERSINMILEGKDRSVTVDLICASARVDHALCIEAKSATLDEDQARRYQALTAINLLRLAALPPEIEPTELTHDVAYVTQRDHTSSLVKQFDAIGIVLPLVAGDGALFDLVRGAFGQPEIQRIFAEGIAVNARAWPRHFVPFKSDSAIADMVTPVTQALSGFIIRGEDFTITALAERSVPHWSLCGEAEQHAFRTKIAGLANRAMREELAGYYERPGAAQAWRITGGRMTRPAQTERLKRLAAEFIEHVQTGRPPAPAQLPLDLSVETTDDVIDDEEDVEDEAEE